MIDIRKIKVIDELDNLKSKYIEQTSAPLDGMWLVGFVPMATHYGLYKDKVISGYFCINEEGYILQYILDSMDSAEIFQTFKQILKGKFFDKVPIKGVICSTAEKNFLSVCLDNLDKHKVKAFMYQKNSLFKEQKNEQFEMLKVKEESIEIAVGFAKEAIGAPIDWLRSYLLNLIKRGELYALFEKDQIIATGEYRRFDEYQAEYVDLGVIVSKNERSKGLGTKVLNYLSNIAENEKLIPICSTEVENISAQKAICRAGFYGADKIVQFFIS